MTLQDLIDKDQAAKTYHGKHGAVSGASGPTAANEIGCKYYEPTVDLSSHTPAEG